MSLKEFFGWYNQYSLEPFGTVVDDKRHVQLMTALHNILVATIGKKAPDIKLEDMKVSSAQEEVEKLKKWLYTDLERPWIDTQKSQEQLVAEGKALLLHWSAQTGIPIT